MSALSDLERAVLGAIALQLPEIAEAIALQQEDIRVLARENTGAGFYTTLESISGPPIIGVASPVGDVGASIQGLDLGMGFVLWLKNDRLYQLEGYSYDESTNELDFEHLKFASVSPRASKA